MSDLPDRDQLRHPAKTQNFVDYMNDLAKLAVAYCDGVLKTRDEIRQLLIEIGLLPAVAEEMVNQMWGNDE